MPIFLNEKGVSLIELSVGIGISALIAMGTGGVILENIKAAQAAKEQGAIAALAEEIRNEINSAGTRRRLYEGTAAERENCGGTLRFRNLTPSVLNEMADKQGADLIVNLRDQNQDVSKDAANNTQASSYGGNLRVFDLKLVNAVPVASDVLTATISGDIYVMLGNDQEMQGGSTKRRPYFVGRVTLKRDAATGSVSDCNVPSTAGSSLSYCSSVLGSFYDPATRLCVNYQLDQQGETVQYCKPGTYGIRVSNDNVVCVPEVSSGSPTGDSDNRGEACRGWHGSGPTCCNNFGNTDAPQPAPAGGIGATLPAPAAGVDESCAPYWRYYNFCVANGAVTGNGSACREPPRTGCAIVKPVTPPLTIGGPGVAIVPAAAEKCQCGGNPSVAANFIAVDEYCGYCTFEISPGFHQANSLYNVEQCTSNGTLVRVASGTNDYTDITASQRTKLTSRCRARRFKIESGDAAAAKAGDFLSW